MVFSSLLCRRIRKHLLEQLLALAMFEAHPFGQDEMPQVSPDHMAKEVLAGLLRKRSTVASTPVSRSKLLPHEFTAHSTIITCDLFHL
jgi:hypothetical protein